MACCSLSLIGYVLTFLIILKMCLKLATAWDRSSTCLIGKTTIVTGSNTGIGFYTAMDFAKRGARVILACRDKEKAEKAKNEIIEKTGNPNVVVRTLNLTSLASIRKFANEIKRTEERLDILVNNAGIAGVDNHISGDGLNLLMQVNYFGPALLSLLLVELLKRSTPSRIVNVSSLAAMFAKINPNDLNAWPTSDSKSVQVARNYCNSKFCNIIFSNELTRKLKGSGVTVNSLHPGTVRTQIFKRIPQVIKEITDAILYLFFKTPEEGAQTSIYVSVSKDLEHVSGEYFENCRNAWLPSMPNLARDEGLAKKVWEQTEECIKLIPEERDSFKFYNN